jgi:hypothetical protein
VHHDVAGARLIVGRESGVIAPEILKRGADVATITVSRGRVGTDYLLFYYCGG